MGMETANLRPNCTKPHPLSGKILAVEGAVVQVCFCSNAVTVLQLLYCYPNQVTRVTMNHECDVNVTNTCKMHVHNRHTVESLSWDCCKATTQFQGKHTAARYIIDAVTEREYSV